MNITITFGTNDQNFSVWSKSDFQNTIALYKLLSKVKEFNVRLVNVGIDTKSIKPEPGIGICDIKHHTWDNVKDNTDLLIETSAKINKTQKTYLKSKNCKIISYRVDNSYVSDLEDIIFNNSKLQITNNEYDEIWILQDKDKINEHYLKELYNTNIYTLPYIWDEEFIKEYEEFLLQTEQELKYKIHNSPKNIIILENNTDTLNSSLLPILTVNKVYKDFPHLINKLWVFNSYHLKTNNRYVSIINNLKIFKDQKTTFENNHPNPFVLSTVTDIVISHQDRNEISNLYFDVFYGKYPLLHNSEPLKGYGFYYDKFNIDEASKKLIIILNKYHLIKDDYNTKCDQVLYSYSTNNQANINRYKERILNLLK